VCVCWCWCVCVGVGVCVLVLVYVWEGYVCVERLTHTHQHQHTHTQNTHTIRHRGHTSHHVTSSWIFRFFRLSRPPKGWQNRQNRKSKRFQNTRNTPETRNISTCRIEHVYLKAPYTMKGKRQKKILTFVYNLIELYVLFESQWVSSNEFHQMSFIQWVSSNWPKWPSVILFNHGFSRSN